LGKLGASNSPTYKKIFTLKLMVGLISPTAASRLFWSSVIAIVSIVVSVVPIIFIIVVVTETLSLTALSKLLRSLVVRSPQSLTSPRVILTNDKEDEKTENKEVEEELHGDDWVMHSAQGSLTQAE